jgi:hypothetical protein
MHDLPRNELREQRLPPVVVTVIGDLAREGRVAPQEALRQIEQRPPQLILDL